METIMGLKQVKNNLRKRSDRESRSLFLPTQQQVALGSLEPAQWQG